MKSGDSVTCKIKGTFIDDAKLVQEGGGWFICQNKYDGYTCSNRLGYKYSWSIGDDLSDKRYIAKCEVTELQSVEPEPTQPKKDKVSIESVVIEPEKMEQIKSAISQMKNARKIFDE